MMSGYEDIEEVEKDFEEMKAQGWDITKKLFWIFSLSDREKWKLETIFNKVQLSGFKLSSMTVVDEKIWCMSLTKYEVLTAKEIYILNSELAEFSEDFAIERYEGWEVLQEEV